MLVQRTLREAEYRLQSVRAFGLFSDPAGLVASRAEALGATGAALEQALRTRLSAARERLAHAASAIHRASPAAMLAGSRERLEARELRLHGAIAARLSREHQRVDAVARELRAVGPAQVLARGYSLTLREDGAIVRSTSDAPAGTQLTTRLADGTVRSRVEGEGTRSPLPGGGRGSVQKPRIRLSPRREDGSQGGLFA
jgi:exodeoxyribonuclease VII large subunit